jgi:hypothetical protein
MSDGGRHDHQRNSVSSPAECLKTGPQYKQQDLLPIPPDPPSGDERLAQAKRGHLPIAAALCAFG